MFYIFPAGILSGCILWASIIDRMGDDDSSATKHLLPPLLKCLWWTEVDNNNNAAAAAGFQSEKIGLERMMMDPSAFWRLSFLLPAD